MNEASLVSGVLFFVCFIGLILVIGVKESSLPKEHSTISSAPFWLNLIIVAMSYLPYRVWKLINVILLLLLTILFFYLFLTTLGIN